ncbi:hypothetical protein PV328_004529 [Microctonus aethiopoides]|uniref:Uncharacterized protein n=1 Tax=Microctonus aethiopoides TaxID=144406 RepID=A0AA39FAS0_9HYME|nr:hypothetical protein PV328_004529 [Microctonus aethiopoides]
MHLCTWEYKYVRMYLFIYLFSYTTWPVFLFHHPPYLPIAFHTLYNIPVCIFTSSPRDAINAFGDCRLLPYSVVTEIINSDPNINSLNRCICNVTNNIHCHRRRHHHSHHHHHYHRLHNIVDPFM